MTLNIRPHLLWEYNVSTFNFEKGAAIVIERVIERGNLKEWREIVTHYGKEKVIQIANISKQLSKRDKDFATLFVHSGFLVL